MENDASRICTALDAVPGVKTVTRGWPKDKDPLPCLAVALSGRQTVDRRDDAAYLQQQEYYVRVFAKTTTEMDTLAQATDAAMQALGYEQTFAWEDSTQSVCQLAMRYRITT